MSGIDPGGLVAETLIDSETLQARIAELGAQITRDYADDPPLLVCVLKGSVMFLADLVRQSPCRQARLHRHLVLRRRDGVVGCRPDHPGPVAIRSRAST